VQNYCETRGIFVDVLRTKMATHGADSEIGFVFRDCHMEAHETNFGTSNTRLYLRRFPRFHSTHHNNKLSFAKDLRSKLLSINMCL
jgi:hypothetical protein